MAKVKNVSARDYVAAKADQSENITRFIVRWSRRLESEIEESMIIDYKGKKFEIESIINDDEANVTLTFVGRVIF